MKLGLHVYIAPESSTVFFHRRVFTPWVILLSGLFRYCTIFAEKFSKMERYIRDEIPLTSCFNNYERNLPSSLFRITISRVSRKTAIIKRLPSRKILWRKLVENVNQHGHLRAPISCNRDGAWFVASGRRFPSLEDASTFHFSSHVATGKNSPSHVRAVWSFRDRG